MQDNRKVSQDRWFAASDAIVGAFIRKLHPLGTGVLRYGLMCLLLFWGGLKFAQFEAEATPFYTYSTGKGATATVAHVLAERGVFDYDTPIVELWPEFGVHGKESATVGHALTHTVGVPGVPDSTTPEDLCDWDKMCEVIADAEPWWEPGTETAYHVYPFGYIIGEIVRRATGMPISQVLREEVAGPLGVVGELFFGVPASELGRLARLEDAEGSAEMLASMPDDSPFFKLGPRL